MKYTLDEIMDVSEVQYYWLFATASALELRGTLPDHNLVPTNKMVEKLGQPNLHELPPNNRRKKYDENDIFTEIEAARILWPNAALNPLLKHMEEIEKLAEKGEIDARAIQCKLLDKKGQKYYIVVLSQIKNKLMNNGSTIAEDYHGA